MSRVLYRIGHFAGRHPWRVLAAWVLIAVTAVVLNCVARRRRPTRASRLPGAESQRAADAIEDRFPQETLNTLQRRSSTPRRASPSRPPRRPSTQAVAQLADGQHVIDVSDPYDPRGPTVSKDGTTAFATVAFDTAGDRRRRTSRPLRRPSRSPATPASRSSTTRASAYAEGRR